MQPMRIRAHLLDGRIAGTESYFPLDSIMAAEVIRRQHPESFYNPPPPGSREGWIEAQLPFERRGQGEKWYWACSFNQSKPLREYITYWNRRVDDQYERYIDFKGRRGKIDASSGRYKAYRMPLNILIFNYLEWFAVGDIEKVKSLCIGVSAVGKKPSQGYGLINHWEVKYWSEDWSEVGPEGQLMRALYELPDGVLSAQKRQHGMVPPYWRKPEVVYLP